LITDGQIYLENDLFYSGVRPAVNVGISVSRVGGNAQLKAMKQVAGTLRLDLAQYRNLAAFAQFGSDLDKASQAQLARGQRMVEILKQPQFAPVDVALQIASIFAGTKGYMDSLKVDAVLPFEAGLHEYLKSKHQEVLSAIVATGKLEKATEETLSKAIAEFKDQFVKNDASVQVAAAEVKPQAKAPPKAETPAPVKATA
jgi:F-type H+-transporting ATPase subunit alpha